MSRKLHNVARTYCGSHPEVLPGDEYHSRGAHACTKAGDQIDQKVEVGEGAVSC